MQSANEGEGIIVNTQRKAVLVVAIILAAGVAAFLVARSAVAAATARRAASAPTAASLVKVTRGDLSASVAASGQLQPNTITTIRPDSNMPTRKLVKIAVTEGQHVKAGQPLAVVDPSGLDLDLQSARATYEAEKAKLANLQARPAGLDTAAAEASLASARNTLDSAQESYDSTKSLFDKNLAARKDLTDAERALQAAKASYNSALLSWQNVKGQNADADIQAQRAALATSQSALEKAQLVFDSITIRSPVGGVVAEIVVNVGDLISPSTALMTVIDPDPMWLQAQVNETDMAQVKLGQTATVTPSGYPDLTIRGTVKQLDLHAQVVSSVSVFTTTIEVPNHDGKLLWGMNADAEISVLALKNVLTLPSSAIKTRNGASTVTIIDGGQQVAWDVQTGATDGTRTQIVAGLDEGTEVVVTRRSTGTAASGAAGAAPRGGPPVGSVFGIFR
jgi:HlyD family secretion protein